MLERLNSCQLGLCGQLFLFPCGLFVLSLQIGSFRVARLQSLYWHQVENHITFYDLGSKILQCSTHHVLLVEAVTKVHQVQVEETKILHPDGESMPL